MKHIAKCIAALLLTVGLAACAATPREGEVQLSLADVQETFIGTPWHGPGGAFIFRDDGTYTYKDFGKATPRGTWSYTIESDGTLRGSSTSYTFYKNGDGYRYYHSRSGQFYSASPNKEPFL